MENLSYPPMSKARVLVVEDENTTRKAITQALNLMGYQAEEAASGSLALDKLSSNPYDLMLLDLRMPGLDGMQVMKRLKDMRANQLVIVLTAHASLESAIAAVRAGAADYLLKPCSIRDIETAISRALRYHQERLRRQELIRVIADALETFKTGEGQDMPVSPGWSERFIQYGPISLDREKRLVVVTRANADSLNAELTANEAALLDYLMQCPDSVLSCRKLAQAALGYDVSEREAEEIIRPHISRLRKKVETDPAQPRLIRTIRGKGYLLSAQ